MSEASHLDLDQALERAGIDLPRVMPPLGDYLYASEHAGIVFVSGQTPTVEGRPLLRGRLGQELTVEQGYDMARLTMLNVLAILRHHLGDLSRVDKILRITGYIAAVPEFAEHPRVLDGASHLMRQVWGARGAHARLAVGVAGLPQQAPVEIEAIVALRDS